MQICTSNRTIIPLFLSILFLLSGCDSLTGSSENKGEGNVEIITSSNPFSDPDGFIIAFSDTSIHAQSSDTLFLENIEGGSHQVELDNLSPNCSLQDEEAPSIEIEDQQTTSLTLSLTCNPLHNLIVYTRGTRAEPQSYDLYMTDPEGSTLTQITNNSTQEIEPAVSPDGTKIAFVRDDDIWVMDADGKNQEQLTETGTANSPAWSPNGEEIVFSSNHGEGRRDIYLMNPDGSNIRNLTNDPFLANFSPNWSPDASRIVFQTYYVEDDPANSEIFSIDMLAALIKHALPPRRPTM